MAIATWTRVNKDDGSFDKGLWLTTLRVALVPNGGLGEVFDTLNL